MLRYLFGTEDLNGPPPPPAVPDDDDGWWSGAYRKAVTVALAAALGTQTLAAQPWANQQDEVVSQPSVSLGGSGPKRAPVAVRYVYSGDDVLAEAPPAEEIAHEEAGGVFPPPTLWFRNPGLFEDESPSSQFAILAQDEDTGVRPAPNLWWVSKPIRGVDDAVPQEAAPAVGLDEGDAVRPVPRLWHTSKPISWGEDEYAPRIDVDEPDTGVRPRPSLWRNRPVVSVDVEYPPQLHVDESEAGPRPVPSLWRESRLSVRPQDEVPEQPVGLTVDDDPGYRPLIVWEQPGPTLQLFGFDGEAQVSAPIPVEETVPPRLPASKLWPTTRRVAWVDTDAVPQQPAPLNVDDESRAVFPRPSLWPTAQPVRGEADEHPTQFLVGDDEGKAVFPRPKLWSEPRILLWGDPAELPPFPLVDEDYWQNRVSAVPATLRRLDPWTHEQHEQAVLHGQPDEDYWRNPTKPVPATLRRLSPWLGEQHDWWGAGEAPIQFGYTFVENSGPRYVFTDESGALYSFAERSGPRYVFTDRSQVR